MLTKDASALPVPHPAALPWSTREGDVGNSEKRSVWEITAHEIGTALRHGGPVDPTVYADHDDQPIRIAMTDPRPEQRRTEQRRPVPSGRR
ncbi:MAG: hypothetical protein ACT4QF_09380 [Sporichthyaceae bacterium]